MRYVLPAFFLICQFGQAGDADLKTTFERWDVAFLDGQRAGNVHTIVTRDGDRVVGSVELRLSVKRLSDVVALGMDNGTYESPEGVVTGVFMKQYLGKNQNLDIQGKVDGKKIVLTLNKNKALEPAPWNDQVVGIAKQQRLFRDRAVKPGDEFSYLSFEPSINLVVTTRVQVKEFEMVELLPGTGKKKFLRVEAKGDKIQNFQPPPLTIWLDDDLDQVRSETNVPALGKMTLVKSTKAFALAPAVGGAKTLEANRVIPLNARLDRAHDLTSATFRIRVKDDADPSAGFSTDGRQRPGIVKNDTFEIVVKRGIVGQADKAPAECLASSYFITSADAKVKAHARKAVGQETDAWKKALLIEKYVHAVMKPKAYELLAPADRVAQTLEGDCTEYAMLAAAMCRAEGVPSRTAIGLVYGEVRGQPSFVFHMWTEVWVRGQWTSIDATLGLGGIGAAHLKVSDQTWHDESSMTPLLPTLNLLGRLSIDIVRWE